MSAISRETAARILAALEGGVQEKWVLRTDTGREVPCTAEADGDGLVTTVTPEETVTIPSGGTFTIEHQVTVSTDDQD